LLGHRGPDFAEILNIEKLSFGHVRLSIQDLTAEGNQPFTNGKQVLLYNGEIYNSLYLKKKFNLKNSISSDTKILFEGLNRYGIKFLHHVDGMYAILFFDGNCIFLARDPAGIKNLYYHFDEGDLIVSSEIKLIKKHIKLHTDQTSKIIFESFRFIPGPHTMYKEVKKLVSGEILKFKIQNNQLTLQENSEILFQPSKISFNNTIKNQLISDVPVAMLVSGGIDSSLLSSIYGNLKYYHSTNKTGFKSELGRVRKNKFLKDNLQVLELDNGVLDNTIVEQLEEPVSANSVVFLDSLMKSIKETVIIAGQGGDELFFGYTRYRIALLYDIVSNSQISYTLLKRIKTKLSNYIIQLIDAENNIERISILLNGISSNHLHKENLDEIMNKYPDFEKLNKLSLLEAIVEFDRKYSLPDELLMYTDKISMRYSKEVRVPLLSLNIKRLKPYSFEGIINVIFPKITLRLKSIKNGVYPSLKKIGFEYDMRLSKKKLQEQVWTVLSRE